ncbi:MAG: hypothetical protein WAN11_15070 [Syntrophobacteraceae bacterium]
MEGWKWGELGFALEKEANRLEPRMSKSAAKGWWIPVNPNGNFALALAMTQWILGNKRYGAEDFHLKMIANLAAGDNPGREVPEADGEELELLRKARRYGKRKKGEIAVCPGCGEAYPTQQGGRCLACQGKGYYDLAQHLPGQF